MPLLSNMVLIAIMLLTTTSLASPSSATPDPHLGQELIRAVAAGKTKLVADLIPRHADLETRNERLQTPLLIATHANNIEIARLLIEAGADVNAKDDMQDSAYLYAGASGFNEILKMTLTHGADLKSYNRYGGTALIPACERGHVETVKIMIASDVDIDHVNNLGWTGLLESIILNDGGPNQQEIVTLLIAAGADVNLPDFDGVTPLQHAQARGFIIIADLLRAAGAH